MKSAFADRYYNFRTFAFFYLAIFALATLHQIILMKPERPRATLPATTSTGVVQRANNYFIFRASFQNLIHGKDLYSAHPEQYDDLFKYSPTFALLMAPFSLMPTWLGLLLWNLLNVGLPCWAVNRLEVSLKAKVFVLLFVLLELLTCVQNAQSNGIMVGLMIGAFGAFERKQVVFAALLICLAFYLKIFGAAVGVLFLFYPGKMRFLLGGVVLAMLLLLALALVAGVAGNGPGAFHLMDQYRSWVHLLAHDPAHGMNYSIMTLMQAWFHVEVPDRWYLIPGLLLLLLPLARIREWQSFGFRLMFLASLLIWTVIFNHKAESPTYVIGIAGVALWALVEPSPRVLWPLLVLAYVLTSLGPTDLFTRAVKTEIWQPLCLKALPCIVVWLVVTWRLMLRRNLEPRLWVDAGQTGSGFERRG